MQRREKNTRAIPTKGAAKAKIGSHSRAHRHSNRTLACAHRVTVLKVLAIIANHYSFFMSAQFRQFTLFGALCCLRVCVPHTRKLRIHFVRSPPFHDTMQPNGFLFSLNRFVNVNEFRLCSIYSPS